MNSSATCSSERTIRIDPEHCLADLMRESIRRAQLCDVELQLCGEEVWLRGAVDSWHAKQIAQEVIRPLARQRRIRNHLTVGT